MITQEDKKVSRRAAFATRVLTPIFLFGWLLPVWIETYRLQLFLTWIGLSILCLLFSWFEKDLIKKKEEVTKK